MKSLEKILGLIEPKRVYGATKISIENLQFDSRKVSSDDVYVATRGFSVDGHSFIQSSVDAGASAIVCEDLPAVLDKNVTYVVVPNARKALALMTNAFFDFPSRSLKLFGVTGTNGKTTTATLMYQIASRLGLKSGLLSTVANYVGSQEIPSTHTTGDPIQICSLMSDMVQAGCTHCFMEVTSHALDQDRTTGLEFDVGVFTNLSQDHLDYHGSMGVYAQTKKSFFDGLPANSHAILNADDDYSAYMSSSCSASISTFGFSEDADFEITDCISLGAGIEFRLKDVRIKSVLSGKYNVSNLAGAISALSHDQELAKIATIAPKLSPVAGRLQQIPSTFGVTGFVDFAHTPDAVKNVLKTLRDALPAAGRLIAVLGCGGDRDEEKRPEMAKHLIELSDYAILTSDNPRSEDPKQIIEDMKAGIPSAYTSGWCEVIDRKDAISRAVDQAAPGDFIVVAGKGHENYQEVLGVKYEFDDVVELAKAFSVRADQ